MKAQTKIQVRQISIILIRNNQKPKMKSIFILYLNSLRKRYSRIFTQSVAIVGTVSKFSKSMDEDSIGVKSKKNFTSFHFSNISH